MPIHYIEALVGIFLNLMQIKPREFYTTSLAVAITILKNDEIDKQKDNGDWIAKLNKIKDCTHPDLNIPLAKAEALVDSTPIEAWGRSIDIQDNDGNRIKIRGREASVLDIYQYLKESYYEILEAVSNVVKDYSLDIRFRFGEGSGSMPSYLQEE